MVFAVLLVLWGRARPWGSCSPALGLSVLGPAGAQGLGPKVEGEGDKEAGALDVPPPGEPCALQGMGAGGWKGRVGGSEELPAKGHKPGPPTCGRDTMQKGWMSGGAGSVQMRDLPAHLAQSAFRWLLGPWVLISGQQCLPRAGPPDKMQGAGWSVTLRPEGPKLSLWLGPRNKASGTPQSLPDKKATKGRAVGGGGAQGKPGPQGAERTCWKPPAPVTRGTGTWTLTLCLTLVLGYPMNSFCKRHVV